jgi:hypothetical protein
MSESTSWRRGFAAGFLALALSVGGHLATAGGVAGTSCSMSRMRLTDRLADRVAADVDMPAIAQRVARAVLGAVLHPCS